MICVYLRSSAVHSSRFTVSEPLPAHIANGSIMDSWDVIVVGGGPAGLTAASQAAQRGRRTLLVEKRPAAGAKILLSGGTRCNLTHATDPRGIAAAFAQQGRFLHSALAALGPAAVVDLFAAEGVATRVETDGKVFPQSDRAADVLSALLARLRRTSAATALDEPVTGIRPCGGGLEVATARRTLAAQSVILATGGQSYPGSGSTGDGYRFAAALGHTVIEPRPALVPITTHAPDVLALQGITMADASLAVLDPTVDPLRPARLAQQRGSLLFAHFGVSGPAVLDVSRAVSRHARPASLVLRCDFLPELPSGELESLLQAGSRAAGKRLVAGRLAEHLPQRLAETVAQRAGLPRSGVPRN
jgi:predicted Rossmann fold flavoprotein